MLHSKTNDNMRKNLAILMMALTGLVACQKMEEELVQEEKPAVQQEETSVWTLTVQAQKESETKGLNLDGTKLNTLWKSGEKVAVYKGGSYLGLLDVTPDGSNAHLATLSGTVNVTDIAENDDLTLLFPKKDWDYTGQTGVLLADEGSIEKDYDFAQATVTVASVSGSGETGSITTSVAHFQNEQSIYRISFKEGETPLAVKSMTLSSSQDKLVRSKVLGGETTYGDLSVNMATTSSALTDGLICVAVRNEDQTEQDYHFSVADADGKAYIGSKHIPTAAFAYGFLGIKGVTVTQVVVGKSETEVGAAL